MRISHHPSNSRRITLGGILGAVVLVAACGGAGAPSGAAETQPTTGAPSSAASAPAPAGSPAPTNLALLGIALLPQASFDPATVQVACDESALGGGTTPVTCDQVVEVAARLAATVSANPIKQVAVSRPADNPDAVQLTFWVAAEEEGGDDVAFTSVFDPANLTVSFPAEDPEAVFTPTM